MLERTSLFAESWNVAWRKGTSGEILENHDKPFVIIRNSFRYWAADPFLFYYDGKTYIFSELYDYIRCRGCLGYCILTEKGVSAWKVVISEPYHLSYPQIFEMNGNIYIMPESGANKTLHVYKAMKFPDDWKRTEELRSGVLYGDTTLMPDRRYALTYDVSYHERYRLCLLDIKDSQNDIEIQCEDWKQRRPAGAFFCMADKTIRPAQICENDYGEGLVFFDCKFNDGEYREEVLDKIYPSDLHFQQNILLDGMHTYNSLDGYEVIDIKTRRFNLLNLFFRLLSKLKR